MVETKKYAGLGLILYLLSLFKSREPDQMVWDYRKTNEKTETKNYWLKKKDGFQILKIQGIGNDMTWKDDVSGVKTPFKFSLQKIWRKQNPLIIAWNV